MILRHWWALNFLLIALRKQNEKEKGPSREGAAEVAVPGSSEPSLGSVSLMEARVNAPLTFIVGNEHIEVTAKIEIVRFTF